MPMELRATGEPSRGVEVALPQTAGNARRFSRTTHDGVVHVYEVSEASAAA